MTMPSEKRLGLHTGLTNPYELFYTWGKEGAGNSPDAVELLNQDFPTAEAVGPAVLLGSLDRVDYLPPPAAAPAPTDVTPLMSIGAAENAGKRLSLHQLKYSLYHWKYQNMHTILLLAIYYMSESDPESDHDCRDTYDNAPLYRE
ncbi:hypothetical protein QE152_g10907 [Popillia japonica]|uniref:Uncharacterized protein n=1 Tax=Popillia japonica TaxID=7064 RepID=A0AAW1LUV1_POPJA